MNSFIIQDMRSLIYKFILVFAKAKQKCLAICCRLFSSGGVKRYSS